MKTQVTSPMPNITKKQHFVPRFYLKEFADPKNFLQVMDVKNHRIGKPRPYAGVGYEYFYYALTTGVKDEIAQSIEEWLRPMEDYIAGRLPRIIEKIETRQQIQDDDKYVLSVLMSMLWLRTPGMRTQMNAMNEDIIKQINNLHGKKLGDKFKVKDNATHLRFMVNSLGFGDAGFANMFFTMKWKIFLANGNEQFVTTDSPVVEKWQPPKSFYGASFMQRDKYFALTPKIFLYLTCPIGATKIKRETLFAEQDNKVQMLNMILASNAQGYLYANRKMELERLLEGRNNPGPLEFEYFNKYEKPWIKIALERACSPVL